MWRLSDYPECALYPEALSFHLSHVTDRDFIFKCDKCGQNKVRKGVCSIHTMAPACPRVPVGSALAPPMVLMLLGWCIRTAGPVTIAGGVPLGAVLTPCCGGCVRDCWLFSKDRRRAGRLFCWWTETETKVLGQWRKQTCQNGIYKQLQKQILIVSPA